MTETPESTSNNRWLWIATAGLLAVAVTVAVVVVGGASDDNDTNAAPTDDPDITGVTLIDPPRPVEDFTLPASTGGEVSLSDFDGKAVLLYFGYTNCPDFCPPTLLDYTRIKNQLGDDAENVVFVFVSVDPERDTVERMTAYMNRFDPEFVAMQADDSVLEAIQDDYDLTWAVNKTGPDDITYTVDHTISKFLIDPQGRLARIFSFGVGTGTITENIRAILG